MGNYIGGRAVVLGGSIAGMLAAGVLSDAYENVVIVDRDEPSDVRDPRRGVPQGRHAHRLLSSGQEILEELFPVRRPFNGYRIKTAPTGPRLVGITRPVLENHVRQRDQAIPGVPFREGHDAVGLVADGGVVRTARAQSRQTGAEVEEIDTDVGVDTTGRGSRGPTRLEPMGYPRAPEDRVKVGPAHTSRKYRRHTDPVRGDMSINPAATLKHPRGAFPHAIDGNLGLLSLTGTLGDHPRPTRRGSPPSRSPCPCPTPTTRPGSPIPSVTR
ncbi:hypothetical protein AB0H12_22975 [Actinosynnema sp. NPDC023794]